MREEMVVTSGRKVESEGAVAVVVFGMSVVEVETDVIVANPEAIGGGRVPSIGPDPRD